MPEYVQIDRIDLNYTGSNSKRIEEKCIVFQRHLARLGTTSKVETAFKFIANIDPKDRSRFSDQLGLLRHFENLTHECAIFGGGKNYKFSIDFRSNQIAQNNLIRSILQLENICGSQSVKIKFGNVWWQQMHLPVSAIEEWLCIQSNECLNKKIVRQKSSEKFLRINLGGTISNASDIVDHLKKVSLKVSVLMDLKLIYLWIKINVKLC